MCLQAEYEVEQGRKRMSGFHICSFPASRTWIPNPTPLLHHHHPGQIHIGVDCSGFTTESLPSEQIVEAANMLEVIFKLILVKVPRN